MIKRNLVLRVIVVISLGSVAFFTSFAVIRMKASSDSPESRVFLVPDQYIAFDSFFNDSSEKIKKDHLNYFAMTLGERKMEMGYVISYGGKNDLSCDSLNNLKMIKKYLTAIRKIKPERLVFIDGGYVKKGMTDFYIQPKDILPPTPAPTFRLNDVLNHQ